MVTEPAQLRRGERSSYVLLLLSLILKKSCLYGEFALPLTWSSFSCIIVNQLWRRGQLTQRTIVFPCPCMCKVSISNSTTERLIIHFWLGLTAPYVFRSLGIQQCRDMLFLLKAC